MRNILNKRLTTVSAFINSSDKVIDVGCDHGLLGIDLVLHKNINKMISSDINIKPLEKTKENLLKYHLEDKIDVKLGNGLETITKDINTVVISGMGGITIVNILKDINNYPNVEKIIISPNNDFPLTRKEINKLGWTLRDEKMVLEKGKYYLVSCYIKGKKKNNVFFGKLDLHDEIVREYYFNLYNTNKKILFRLSLKNKLKKINLIKDNFLIKKNIK